MKPKRGAFNLVRNSKKLKFPLLTKALITSAGYCFSMIKRSCYKLMEGNGTCEKFINFILRFLPDKAGMENEEDLKGLLKEIKEILETWFLRYPQEEMAEFLSRFQSFRTFFRTFFIFFGHLLLGHFHGHFKTISDITII